MHTHLYSPLFVCVWPLIDQSQYSCWPGEDAQDLAMLGDPAHDVDPVNDGVEYFRLSPKHNAILRLYNK